MMRQKTLLNCAAIATILSLLFAVFIWLLPVVTSNAGSSVSWVGSNRTVCSEACSREDLKPIASGNYIGGGQYFVCATEASGIRPGYNLEGGRGDAACYVGRGGEEQYNHIFHCLCTSHDIRQPFN